jgi:hypothetical protein
LQSGTVVVVDQAQRFVGNTVLQNAFGERWAVVGQMGLVSDERDRAEVAETSQLPGSRQPRERRPDHGD